MSINVTCPSCLKRFTVSDKFAGKSGPCPSCQKTIKIPDKSEEVVIHAPESAGPTDSTGKAILKPIRRKDVKLGIPIVVGAALAALVVVGIAIGMGLSGQAPSLVVLILGAVGLAPPLVFVGYWFLHDDELEGYDGRQLLIRCGICSLIFACLWAIYGFVPGYVSGKAEMAQYSGLDLAIYLPVMIVIGSVASVLVLELEAMQGAMHYILYFVVTFMLAWLAGTQFAEFSEATDRPPPVINQPVDSGSDEPPKKTINILQ